MYTICNVMWLTACLLSAFLALTSAAATGPPATSATSPATEPATAIVTGPAPECENVTIAAWQKYETEQEIVSATVVEVTAKAYGHAPPGCVEGVDYFVNRKSVVVLDCGATYEVCTAVATTSPPTVASTAIVTTAAPTTAILPTMPDPICENVTLGAWEDKDFPGDIKTVEFIPKHASHGYGYHGYGKTCEKGSGFVSVGMTLHVLECAGNYTVCYAAPAPPPVDPATSVAPPVTTDPITAAPPAQECMTGHLHAWEDKVVDGPIINVTLEEKMDAHHGHGYGYGYKCEKGRDYVVSVDTLHVLDCPGNYTVCWEGVAATTVPTVTDASTVVVVTDAATAASVECEVDKVAAWQELILPGTIVNVTLVSASPSKKPVYSFGYAKKPTCVEGKDFLATGPKLLVLDCAGVYRVCYTPEVIVTEGLSTPEATTTTTTTTAAPEPELVCKSSKIQAWHNVTFDYAIETVNVVHAFPAPQYGFAYHKPAPKECAADKDYVVTGAILHVLDCPGIYQACYRIPVVTEGTTPVIVTDPSSTIITPELKCRSSKVAAWQNITVDEDIVSVDVVHVFPPPLPAYGYGHPKKEKSCEADSDYAVAGRVLLVLDCPGIFRVCWNLPPLTPPPTDPTTPPATPPATNPPPPEKVCEAAKMDEWSEKTFPSLILSVTLVAAKAAPSFGYGHLAKACVDGKDYIGLDDTLHVFLCAGVYKVCYLPPVPTTPPPPPPTVPVTTPPPSPTTPTTPMAPEECVLAKLQAWESRAVDHAISSVTLVKALPTAHLPYAHPKPKQCLADRDYVTSDNTLVVLDCPGAYKICYKIPITTQPPTTTPTTLPVSTNPTTPAPPKQTCILAKLDKWESKQVGRPIVSVSVIKAIPVHHGYLGHSKPKVCAEGRDYVVNGDVLVVLDCAGAYRICYNEPTPTTAATVPPTDPVTTPATTTTTTPVPDVCVIAKIRPWENEIVEGSITNVKFMSPLSRHAYKKVPIEGKDYVVKDNIMVVLQCQGVFKICYRPPPVKTTPTEVTTTTPAPPTPVPVTTPKTPPTVFVEECQILKLEAWQNKHIGSPIVSAELLSVSSGGHGLPGRGYGGYGGAHAGCSKGHGFVIHGETLVVFSCSGVYKVCYNISVTPPKTPSPPTDPPTEPPTDPITAPPVIVVEECVVVKLAAWEQKDFGQAVTAELLATHGGYGCKAKGHGFTVHGGVLVAVCPGLYKVCYNKTITPPTKPTTEPPTKPATKPPATPPPPAEVCVVEKLAAWERKQFPGQVLSASLIVAKQQHGYGGQSYACKGNTHVTDGDTLVVLSCAGVYKVCYRVVFTLPPPPSPTTPSPVTEVVTTPTPAATTRKVESCVVEKLAAWERKNFAGTVTEASLIVAKQQHGYGGHSYGCKGNTHVIDGNTLVVLNCAGVYKVCFVEILTPATTTTTPVVTTPTTEAVTTPTPPKPAPRCDVFKLDAWGSQTVEGAITDVSVVHVLGSSQGYGHHGYGLPKPKSCIKGKDFVVHGNSLLLLDCRAIFKVCYEYLH